MRAVNLIPGDTRRTSLDVRSLRGPGPAVVGLLAVVVALVTMYVLASNSISQRRGELSGLQQQLAQVQSSSTTFTRYEQFTQLAATRAQTVQEIAASRFDWAKALSELSAVVPANTTLQSLAASVDPAATTSSGSSGGGLRGAISSPAFELVGCTATQDDVARLMSRLRVIQGVTRVTLSDSVKDSSAASGAAVSSAGGSAASCGANAPTFDVLVFFQAPAVAPATTTPAATAATTSTTSTTPTPPATTSTTTTTTPASTTPAATTTTPAATPASSSTGGTP
jgi:Tfp pilus assembly protein PilN